MPPRPTGKVFFTGMFVWSADPSNVESAVLDKSTHNFLEFVSFNAEVARPIRTAQSEPVYVFKQRNPKILHLLAEVLGRKINSATVAEVLEKAAMTREPHVENCPDSG